MSEDELALGVELAEKALQWAMWGNGKVTSDQAREAIAVIFGPEVDAAMRAKHAPVEPKERMRLSKIGIDKR